MFCDFKEIAQGSSLGDGAILHSNGCDNYLKYTWVIIHRTVLKTSIKIKKEMFEVWENYRKDITILIKLENFIVLFLHLEMTGFVRIFNPIQKVVNYDLPIFER